MSFIENLEVTKHLDSLIAPKKHFIYLNNSDFFESILEIEVKTEVETKLSGDNAKDLFDELFGDTAK